MSPEWCNSGGVGVLISGGFGRFYQAGAGGDPTRGSAQSGDGFQGHVAGTSNGPLVVPLQEDGAN